MTPKQVLEIATAQLEAKGFVVGQLKFNHTVFLPEGVTARGGQGETWLVYFTAVNPPPDGLSDYDWVTVGVDEETREARVI